MIASSNSIRNRKTYRPLQQKHHKADEIYDPQKLNITTEQLLNPQIKSGSCDKKG